MSLSRSTKIALLVAATFFMENLDATVIATALPDMAKSFNVLPVDLNISMSSYMLALAAFIPISGWLADAMGARLVFTCAIALFCLASALCGLSDSLGAFLAARVLQGFSGALMVPVGRLAVLRATPKKDLVKAIGYITTPALIAPVLGPPLGGLIVMHCGWPWIFYLNLPLGLVALIAAVRLIPDHSVEHVRPFDWKGFVLLGLTCVMLLTGLEVLGQDIHQAWPGIILCVAALMLGIGSFRHMRRAANPLLNLDVLSIPTFSTSFVGASLFRVCISTLPFLLPLMFQLAFGLSPLDAGLLVLTVFAGNLVMKFGTTRIIQQWGFRNVLLVNGIVGAASIAACATFDASTPHSLIMLALFIGGLSRSLQFTAYNTLAFADVPQPSMSTASTLFSISFQLSMGMGVAVAALLLRLSMAMHGNESVQTSGDFHLVFIMIAVLAVIAMYDSWRLEAKAGSAVLQRQP